MDRPAGARLGGLGFFHLGIGGGEVDRLGGYVGDRLEHQARRIRIEIAEAAEGGDFAAGIARERGIGHAVEAAHQRGLYLVALASQAQSVGDFMLLRQQGIKLLERLVAGKRDGGARHRRSGAGKIACGDQIHHGNRPGFCLGSWRIGQPDSVHRLAAVAVADHKLIEACVYRALDAHRFTVKAGWIFQHSTYCCVDCLGKGSTRQRAQQKS